MDSQRVSSLHERIRGAPSSGNGAAAQEAREVTLPARNGDVVGSADYVVTVGFGTPKKDQTVIFDTGSSVSWIQCQPCVGSCYDQQEPIFDPSSSSSYRNISCSSDACRALPSNGCSGGTCLYSVHYGDSSATVGFLGTERLTLATGFVFPNFVFGCGERNEGLFTGIAGLIGLSRSPFSLPTQASQTLGSNVFAYCLPGPRRPAGKLTVGGSPSAAAAYTPMLSNAREPTLYFLDLIGISVGGHPIPVAPTVFQSGTIIDSGTVITRLPPAAYSALRTAFRRAMAHSVKNILVPAITLHYDGANVPLEPTGVLLAVEEGQVCLAFAGNEEPSDVAIIGNIQQRGMEVIYDIGAKQIGFAAGTCS
ncbi:unnamed protein product [Spirodela intermedia]|uniref:Peptidase A1 domain-containing protein n=1 Tax=Spirodela intermedia TaxID=51605 RepID=A0A7I8JKZ4_SPIIN|nr:unnamed protein product [Spirodela intermedia]CAA6670808.1 unnamed protein product [Spirodela intermedia]